MDSTSGLSRVYTFGMDTRTRWRRRLGKIVRTLNGVVSALAAVWALAGGFHGHDGHAGEGPRRYSAAAFSRDGRAMVAARAYDTPDGTREEVVAWDTATGRHRWTARMIGHVVASSFSPDGRTV